MIRHQLALNPVGLLDLTGPLDATYPALTTVDVDAAVTDLTI